MTIENLIEGRCHCGNVTVRAGLTESPDRYTPRSCDCDFCTMHAAQWLSDPRGSLSFERSREGSITRYRQGAEVADMLFCGQCGVLVGACYEDESTRYGVANARIFEERFGKNEVVSPKALSADEKTERWKRIWFRDVRIE